MNISLPTALKAWVEQQVEEGGYSTASEYFRDLVRRAKEAAGRSGIDDQLIEALDGPAATPMTKKDWDWIREEGLRRVKSRRKK
jgi:antitoxin ParD1/3/4